MTHCDTCDTKEVGLQFVESNQQARKPVSLKVSGKKKKSFDIIYFKQNEVDSSESQADFI